MINDRHEGTKAATSKAVKAICRMHHMRNAAAHSGKTQRRMVSAAIGTAVVQDTPEAEKIQWRSVANQARGKFPKIGH